MLSFFLLDVLDEIWDVIESVFEGFLTMQTGLHKHHFYGYTADFAMKRGQSACATTSLNAVKIAYNPIIL